MVLCVARVACLHMHSDEFLDAYFELCRETYLQLKAEGKWLWEADEASSDSQKSHDLIDSEDN